MKKKRAAKEYWEMTTDELREATEEFDQEFIADSAQPLTPEMRARWERAMQQGQTDNPWLAAAGTNDPTDPLVAEWKQLMADYRQALENDPNRP